MVNSTQKQSLKPGWKQVKFGDVVRLSNDRCADPLAEGVERYIGLEHIDPDDLRIRRWGLVEDGITFTTRFKTGQVLFGKRRAYQRKVAVADFEGICSGDIYVFESADPKVLLPELLPFICQTDKFFDYAVSTSAGSLSPRTNWKNLVNFEFYLPSVEDQRRISNLLNLAKESDEMIQYLAIKHSILKSSLIEHRAKELTQSGITKLRQVVEKIESGKSPEGLGRPAKEHEFGVLKVSAVGHWDYYSEENKVISEVQYQASLEVKRGYLLATRANADPDSVGRTCLVQCTRSGLMLSDKTWRIKLKNPKIASGILAWTKSSIFRKNIFKKLSGTEAKNVSQKDFLDSPFPSCSKEELQAFNSEIEVLLRNELELKNRSNNSRNFFKTLINQILGK